MSHPSLSGGVAIVTGAAGGLGSASARRLSEEGVRVVLVDVDGDLVRDVAAALPTEAIWVAADVSNEDDVDRYVEAAVERFGRVDFHHLNAGISGSLAAIPDLSVEDFDSVIAVNLRGVFLGVRAAFRQFQQQSDGERGAGSIVLTASIASLRGSADLLPYQTSKHGVLGILRGAALYGGPLGIRVNAVAPGIVPTELFAGAATAPGGRDDMTQRASTTPLRRAGTGSDIAGVVAFLFSEDAAYMTGEVVSVDGGAAAVSTVRPSGGAGAWDTGAVDRVLYDHHPSSRSHSGRKETER
jgi:NAD(P)-dependent dehydrogenase (short-subunit alcohol dehydrogenase family)